jgi:hypothetical protein
MEKLGTKIMFMIPSFSKMEMSFDEAVNIIKGRANGDLLEGMKSVDRMWKMHCDSQNAFFKGEIDEMIYGDDEEFFEHWCYETNAYNVVFENMSKLFV